MRVFEDFKSVRAKHHMAQQRIMCCSRIELPDNFCDFRELERSFTNLGVKEISISFTYW